MTTVRSGLFPEKLINIIMCISDSKLDWSVIRLKSLYCYVHVPLLCMRLYICLTEWMDVITIYVLYKNVSQTRAYHFISTEVTSLCFMYKLAAVMTMNVT